MIASLIAQLWVRPQTKTFIVWGWGEMPDTLCWAICGSRFPQLCLFDSLEPFPMFVILIYFFFMMTDYKSLEASIFKQQQNLGRILGQYNALYHLYQLYHELSRDVQDLH